MLRQCQVAFGIKSVMPKNRGLDRKYMKLPPQTKFFAYKLVGFLKGPFYTGQKAVNFQT